MAYTNKVFQQRVPLKIDRDALEKDRINDRIGFETRFQGAKNLIYQPDSMSSLHITEHQRFNKDFNQKDKQVRAAQRSKQEKFFQLRRDKRLDKQMQRWDKEENDDKYKETKRLYHQRVLTDNKRNTNGMPFNPITLQYAKDQQGDRLRHQDNQKKVRAYVRAQNLIERSCGYNLITGQTKKAMQVYVPKQLKSRFQEKLAVKRERQTIKYEPIRDKYDYLDDD